MAYFLLAGFFGALLLTAALTPPARRLALRTGLVAGVRPDRAHTEPTPLGGGLAMAVPVALGLVLAWWGSVNVPIGAPTPVDPAPPYLLLDALWHRGGVSLPVRLGMGALLFFVVGLLDDRFDLRPWTKLLLQSASAAVVVLGFGVKATAWMPWPGVPELASVLWVLLLVNAYNLFDHADGMAAASGAAMFLFLAVGQLLMGAVFVPGIALVAAGTLAGFLVWNFPPAKLFMGDAGSHLVGYLLASLTLVARYYFPDQGTPRWVVVSPLLLVAVPLLDAAWVTIVRLRAGRSPLAGDATSHLGHRLLARGWTRGGLVATAFLASAMAGAFSLWPYSGGRLALLAAVLGLVWALLLFLLVRASYRKVREAGL